MQFYGYILSSYRCAREVRKMISHIRKEPFLWNLNNTSYFVTNHKCELVIKVSLKGETRGFWLSLKPSCSRFVPVPSTYQKESGIRLCVFCMGRIESWRKNTALHSKTSPKEHLDLDSPVRTHLPKHQKSWPFIFYLWICRSRRCSLSDEELGRLRNRLCLSSRFIPPWYLQS